MNLDMADILAEQFDATLDNKEMVEVLKATREKTTSILNRFTGDKDKDREIMDEFIFTHVTEIKLLEKYLKRIIGGDDE